MTSGIHLVNTLGGLLVANPEKDPKDLLNPGVGSTPDTFVEVPTPSPLVASPAGSSHILTTSQPTSSVPPTDTPIIYFAPVPLKGKVDPTPYLELLNFGIRNANDLALADRLYEEVSPIAHHLAEKTKGIPVDFIPQEQTRMGHVVAGSTALTYAQAIDRTSGERAHKISYTVPAFLTLPPHERIHAVKFLDLPVDHQMIPLPDISSEATLWQIYQAILSHRHWDEALAFASEIQFTKDFKKATGYFLDQFGIHAADMGFSEAGVAYQKGELSGLKDWIANGDLYLSYKIGVLYIAILVKKGATDFTDWDQVLATLGIRKEKGRLVIPPDALHQIYENYLQPLLPDNAMDRVLMTLGLTGSNLARFEKLIRCLATSSLTPEETNQFLREDMDILVQQVGALAFKDPLEIEEERSTRVWRPPFRIGLAQKRHYF